MSKQTSTQREKGPHMTGWAARHGAKVGGAPKGTL